MRVTLLVGLTLVALAVAPAGALAAPTGQPGASGPGDAAATAAVAAAAPPAATPADVAATPIGAATPATVARADVGANQATVVTHWPTSAIEAGPLSGETRERTTEDEDACEAAAGGPQREDPTRDTLGWENGCWHDDPIAVTVEDGLNETELDAVVARTMARIEFVRELEFNHTVPVDVISRATFRNRTDDRFANLTANERLHQNVKHEALFFVPEDEDAVAQLATNQGGTILGYYSPSTERIVVISDSDGPLQVDGPTLAHELAHALQDQHFDLSRYDRATTEQNNAVSGLLEGDPTYTEHLYDQRCGAEWSCPSQDADGGTSVGPEFDWGIYFMGFQPYSDGGAFVAHLREEGGWEAVDAAYENPPASSEQVMHPEKYPDETPANVTVADRSSDRWRVLALEDGVDYAVYGEPGMASMFISPTYDDRNPVFVSQQDVFTGDDLDLLEYGLPMTDGWNGDKLYPYVTNDSVATNETGYVWKTRWDTRADAREFADAYVELLAYHGAEPVADHVDTYRIPNEEPYGDAFSVEHTNATVVVVNAPTVDELAAIRQGAAPETTATPTPTRVGTPTSAGSTETSPPSDGTETAAGTTTPTPGFGLTVALLALLAAALLARRR